MREESSTISISIMRAGNFELIIPVSDCQKDNIAMIRKEIWSNSTPYSSHLKRIKSFKIITTRADCLK